MTPRQSTCVAIDGRGILIEGPPGIGKTSLALALIDRGAILVGDDSIMLEVRHGALLAGPHPRTRGMLEVRNLGLLAFPCSVPVPVALALRLDSAAPRYVEKAEAMTLQDVQVPLLRLFPDGPTLAIKAELALRHYGLHDGTHR